MGHTPKPWDKSHIYQHSGCGCCTEGFEELDVEHIVKCVNAHEDMLAALEKAKQYVEGVHKNIANANHNNESPAKADLIMINTALAKAKGA